MDQGFRFGQVAADNERLLLEENQQARDEIPLGYAPEILLIGLAFSGGDGDGDETAGKVSAAEEAPPPLPSASVAELPVSTQFLSVPENTPPAYAAELPVSAELLIVAE